MFSSSSANFDPFQYSTITDVTNPNSAAFLSFPFLHENEGLLLSESFTQQNQQQEVSPASESAVKANPEMSPSGASEKTKKKTKTKGLKQQATPRKRTGKKDRHSKIYTAKGPRDRRMRLSLQVARKFFDLQDMLGFDKASKTIDWLFSKSKSAIQEVTNNFSKLKRSSESNGKRTVSCSSESEVVSGIKLTAEKRINETETKPVSISPAKASRDKARARARERTKEKQKNKGIEKSNEPNPSKLDQLDPKEKSAGFGTCISNMDSDSGVTAATKSASIFNLPHLNVANFEEKFSGFQGNCHIKLSTTGNVRDEIPNSFFMANPNSTFDHKTRIPNSVYQDQNLTSLLMASDEQNPSFHFMNFSNSTHQVSTSLFPMSTYFTDNHFSSSTSNLPFKYDGSLF